MLGEFFGYLTGETQSKNRAKFALSALGGLLVGGTLGLLFAPQSGEETREDISDNVEAGYNKVKEGVNELGDKVAGSAKKVGNKVSDTYNQFKEEAEDLKDEKKAERLARRNARLRNKANNSEQPAASSGHIPAN